LSFLLERSVWAPALLNIEGWGWGHIIGTGVLSYEVIEFIHIARLLAWFPLWKFGFESSKCLTVMHFGKFCNFLENMKLKFVYINI
jgi:hypothetical protein